LVHFIKSIGEKEVKLIFRESIRVIGDNINILLAATSFNLKRMMNKWKDIFYQVLKYILNVFFAPFLNLICKQNFYVLENKVFKV